MSVFSKSFFGSFQVDGRGPPISVTSTDILISLCPGIELLSTRDDGGGLTTFPREGGRGGGLVMGGPGAADDIMNGQTLVEG